MPSSRNPFYNCTSPRCPWCDWRCSCAASQGCNIGPHSDAQAPSWHVESRLFSFVWINLWQFLDDLGRVEEACKELTHWKRLWCWEGLGAGGEGDDRGWDGWMASQTRWTWVWVNSGSWWWTGRPGALRFMGSQRVRHDWATELDWIEEVPEWGCPQQLLESPIEFSSFHARALPGKLGSSVPPWNLQTPGIQPPGPPTSETGEEGCGYSQCGVTPATGN